jgi:hypothetical protein
VEDLEGTIDVLHVESEDPMQSQPPRAGIYTPDPWVLSRRAVACHDVVVLHPRHQTSDLLGIELQVCIREEEEISPRLAEASAKGRAIAQVDQMAHEPNAGSRVGLYLGCSGVLRPIIHDQDLPVGENPGPNQGAQGPLSRTYALTDVFRLIVGRQDAREAVHGVL